MTAPQATLPTCIGLIFGVGLVLAGCTSQPLSPGSTPSQPSAASAPTELPEADWATVTAVKATLPTADGYTLTVTVASPDTGCGQYANWWEVLTPEGDLLYRRILAHSHVDEQPFTRSGGPVNISADTLVIVRAHMYPLGYGTQAMQGTITAGFEAVDLPADFAANLADAEPQPGECAF